MPGLRLRVNPFEHDSISDSEREQGESVEHLAVEHSVRARRYLDVMRLIQTRGLVLRGTRQELWGGWPPTIRRLPE